MIISKEDIMHHEVYFNSKAKEAKLVDGNFWGIRNAILKQDNNWVLFIMFDDDLNYNFTKRFNKDIVVMINSYPLKK